LKTAAQEAGLDRGDERRHRPACRFEKNEIEEVVEKLLRSKELLVERAQTAWQALRKFSSSRADFPHCLIERCGQAAQCQYTVTFEA
jgi:predicted nucleic-acid-binding protein